MLDSVIVGGGLCGLSLADRLHQSGQSFALFEARTRLGGRILSKHCTMSDMTIDLGPTWFWPDVQPNMLALVEALQLKHFPQHDQGTVLTLTDPNRDSDKQNIGVHGGAHRVENGMGAIVSALEKRLPKDSIHLEHKLIHMEDKGDHICLQFQLNDMVINVEAKRVVLALPPRLLVEHVNFVPTLDETLVQTMRSTHTWMADQAKAVMGYSKAFWRQDGHSGNAFVSHPQAVLSEVFDASDAHGQHGALGGLSAMPTNLRESFRQGMPMLLESQLAQLFGIEAQNGELHYQDWANEVHTCSTLDQTPPTSQPIYGSRHLRDSYWNTKLFFGGAETASHAGGYLEGALEAATRLALMLSTKDLLKTLNADNNASMSHFSSWLTAQRSQVLARYRSHLNRYMTLQLKEQLTQRALLDTVEQIYREAIEKLNALPLNTSDVSVDKGRSALTPLVLSHFNGINQDLVETAWEFNRNSCAISNFPEENAPAAEYQEAIRLDLLVAWREFALSVNDTLLAR
ncbi:MAG: FAD-dependent oxidoreductase [Methylotenera sp.]|uniref:flavin monoamine oxidase family protein n=1 Tax=Methylotenera sp. TaxID=2051956 RepID=UPI0024885012|nr:FAD-dependent oxidoreductase [Methylotenera sp.]MDI1310438.1 FAD-dependent oxidoreductase [Methylotenera sp.]